MSSVNLDNAALELPEFTSEFFAAKSSAYALLIPVLNEGERIQKQILKMKNLCATVDIYIVDGGSTDHSVTADFLKKHEVTGLFIKTGPGKLSSQLRIGLHQLMAKIVGP